MAFKIGKAIGSFFTWCCKKAFLKATKAVIERVKSVGSKKACPNLPGIPAVFDPANFADYVARIRSK